ncbi:MAG: hypothetical protein AVDCRST_MAG37-697, partial [uncultured Rubrobacteraceae bacterium]
GFYGCLLRTGWAGVACGAAERGVQHILPIGCI